MKTLKIGSVELPVATDTNPDLIHLVVIANPLTPLESRQVFARQWINQPLSDYVTELHGDWKIATSQGGIVEKSELAETWVRPGEYVVLSPVLRGGGGDSGKTILRMVALVALSYFTAGIASGAFGAIGGAGVMGANGVIAGANYLSIGAALGVQIGGALLINAVIPPSQPENDAFATKSTYGLDGPKMTSREGLTIPVVAGEHWVGGNAVSIFTDNVGDDQQYLHLLLALGEGPFESFESVEINEQPSENFTELTFDQRTGTKNQPVIPFFNDVYTPVNRNQMLPSWDFDPKDISYSQQEIKNAITTATAAQALVHTTTGPADQVRLDFVLPLGQGRNRSDGSYEAISVPMWIAYREAGTSDEFLPLGEFYVPDSAASRERNFIDLTTGEREYAATAAMIPESTSPSSYNPNFGHRATRGAVRRSFYSGELDRSKRYEFKMFNPSEDGVDEMGPNGKPKTTKNRKILLADVNEIIRDDVRYPHTALMGLRILMSDQLNSIPSVRVKVKGIKCEVYDVTTGQFTQQWTDNPAWIAYTCMTNTRWGGGIKPSRIILKDFIQWADFCEANQMAFNGVIPQASNIIDGLKPLFAVGRASPIRSGTRIGVSIETQRDMSAMFGTGNIIKGSLSINWSSMSERANEVEVQYYDKDDYNKRKTVIVESRSARERGDEPKVTTLDMRGINNVDQAIRSGTFALNMNSLTRTVKFDAPLDAIALKIGDVFGISHDMPEWGMSGRLEPGSNRSVLTLDREVTMVANKSYQVLVRHDHFTVHTTNISQILGNVVYLPGFDPSTHANVTSLSNIAREWQVDSVVDTNQSGHYGVLLADATGLSTGQPVGLLVTDYMDVKDVVLDVGDSQQITLASQLEKMPLDYANYAFGEANTVVQKYTCRSIKGDGNFVRTIGGLEYSEAIFDDAPADIVVVEVPKATLIENVDFAGFSASMFRDGNVFRYNVQARWGSDQQSYDKAEIWVSMNGEPWEYKGDRISDYSIVAEHLDEIQLALVPIDRWGKKPFRESVDVHSYTVNLNDGRSLTPPLGLTATPSSRSVYLSWLPSTLDESDTVVADGGRPGVFKIFMEEIGHTNAVPRLASGELDVASVTQTPWAENAFAQEALVTADYFNLSGLVSETYYRVWVQEVHPHYADVTSEVSPSGAGLVFETVGSAGAEEAFPDGIKELHLSSDLAKKITQQYDVTLNEMANTVSQTMADIALEADRIDILSESIGEGSDTVSGFANALQALDVRVGETEDGFESVSTDLTSLDSALSDAERGLEGAAEATTLLQTRVETTEDGIVSIGSDITTLSANLTVAEGNIEATSTALGGLVTKVEANEDGVSSVSSDLTELESKVTLAEGNISANATATGGLQTRVTAAEGIINSVSSDLTALESRIQSGVEEDYTTLSSAVGGLVTRVTDNEEGLSAVASDVTELESSISNNVGEAVSQAVGGLTTRVEETEDGILTISQDAVALTTRVGNNETKVQEHGQSIDGVKGRWGVKIDTDGHVVGVRLNSNSSSGSSNFVVTADKFRVFSPSAPQKQIFTIDASADGGNGRVIMNKNVVKTVESENYVHEQSGFKIDGTNSGNGNAEFNNIYARGDIKASSLTAEAVSAISLTADNITAGTITADKLQVAAINTNGSIANGAVNNGQLGGSAVSTAKVGLEACTALRFWDQTQGREVARNDFGAIGTCTQAWCAPGVKCLVTASFELVKPTNDEGFVRYKLLRRVNGQESEVFATHSAEGVRVWGNESNQISFSLKDTPVAASAPDAIVTYKLMAKRQGSAKIYTYNTFVTWGQLKR